MRLSNKSTFSLACLILLMAFVASSVMAHPQRNPGDATPADDTDDGSYLEDHPKAMAPTHPILDKD